MCVGAFFLWIALVTTSHTLPPEAVGLLRQANAEYQAHRPAEAVRLYELYLAQYEDRADVRVFLGGALLNLNRLPEALEQARRASSLDGNYGKAYTLAGRIQTSQHQWTLAREAYELAVRLDPLDKDAWYFAGRGYYDENRFENAVAAFRRAVELGAENSRVYENLGLSYEALTRHQEAEQAYRRSVALAGSDYRPYNVYGRYLDRQGRNAESIRMLETAFAHEPAVEVRFELGKALYHSGRPNEAARIVEGALALSNECRLGNLLVRIYSAQGKNAEAERQVKALETCRQEPR